MPQSCVECLVKCRTITLFSSLYFVFYSNVQSCCPAFCQRRGSFSPHSSLDGMIVLKCFFCHCRTLLVTLRTRSRTRLQNTVKIQLTERGNIHCFKENLTHLFMIRRLFSPTGKHLFFYLFVLLMSYPLIRSWKQKCVDSELTSEEVDELYLIDHDEIMSRLTLKQEVKLMKDRNAVFNFRSWYVDLHWLQWCSESWCALCCSLPVN